MTERVQRFGGSHTERKLDVVAKYLSGYVTVMKKQSWVDLYYIDGFAGSGASSARPEDATELDPTLFDTESITEGSPIRALNVNPPFDHYEFIDANAKNVASLLTLRDRYPDRKIRVHHNDANVAISELCSEIGTQRTARAVVFLDPFGRSVRWETVVKLAETEKVDLWYLVPVHAISRQVSKKGEFLPSAEMTDIMYGSTEWRLRAVRKLDVSTDLFGGIDERLEKIAQAKEYTEMFRDRLRSVFKGGVADVYLPLGRGRLHEYSLMFACANPSPSAYGKALSIASHILRTA